MTSELPSSSLWVDKYRPRTLDSMDYHTKLCNRLKTMVSVGDFPHLMFYGPSGSGKKTRVMALLREVYGAGVDKLKVSAREFKVGSSGSTKVELTLISSNYHIELNPSDAGNHDKSIIQQVLAEVSESRSLVAGGLMASMGGDGGASSSSSSSGVVPMDVSSSTGRASAPSFKVVILNEVDKLSRQAQNALRRTMETATASCRLVLIGNSTTKIIEPLRSRCLCLRIGAPSEDEALGILNNVAMAEGFVLEPTLGKRIVQTSRRNMRRALLALETCKVQEYPFRPEQEVAIPDWEIFVGDIAKAILEKQTPESLKAVRGMFYDLLTHCIPPSLILNTLVDALMPKLDAEIKHGVALDAASYEHRLQLGTKAIFHLEAFVAQFMHRYKRFLVETFGA